MEADKKKILIVDDSDTHFKIVKDVLNQSKDNYDIERAETGTKGLDKILKGHYDLVLLDFELPGMNGLEVLESAINGDVDFPIVMLTGAASEKVAVNALKKGASDYVSKSFDSLGAIPIVVKENIKKFELKKSEEKQKNLQKPLKQAHVDLEKRYSVLQEEYAQLKRKVEEFQFIEPSEKPKPKLGEEEKKIIDKLENSALIKYTTKEELTNSVEKIIDVFYKNGNPIIFITSQPRAFQSYKVVSKLLQEGAIQIVDMSSGWAVGTQPSPYITIPMTHLFLFGDIIRKIPENSVFILEPLSQLILARGFETTYQFLENYSGELANRGITFIALLKTSAHSPEEVGGIENIFLNTVTVSVGGFI